jgi:hypothetical protein
MSFVLKPECRFLIGNAGVSQELYDRGVIATICSEVEPKNGEKHLFVDLHTSRNQLEGLRDAIDDFLRFHPQIQDCKNTHTFTEPSPFSGHLIPIEPLELLSHFEVKALKIAIEILEMHAVLAGNRTCQDWSGFASTLKIFDRNEWIEAMRISEMENSGGADFDPEYVPKDEMVIYFAIADVLRTIVSKVEAPIA